MLRLLSIFCYLVLSVSCLAQDCDRTQTLVSTTPTVEQSPHKLRRAFALQAEAVDGTEIMLVGDSISEGWTPHIRRDFPGRKVFNFGIGGDRTQEVLWRLENTLPKGLSPHAIVLVIGTNNFSDRSVSVCGVVSGIASIVEKLHSLWPEAVIFVMPVLPRGQDFAYRNVERSRINASVGLAYEQNKNITLVSVDEAALTCNWRSDGCSMYTEDTLHPIADGYREMRAALARTSVQKFGADKLE